MDESSSITKVLLMELSVVGNVDTTLEGAEHRCQDFFIGLLVFEDFERGVVRGVVRAA
jgi:hypothetical protein